MPVILVVHTQLSAYLTWGVGLFLPTSTPAVPCTSMPVSLNMFPLPPTMVGCATPCTLRRGAGTMRCNNRRWCYLYSIAPLVPMFTRRDASSGRCWWPLGLLGRHCVHRLVCCSCCLQHQPQGVHIGGHVILRDVLVQAAGRRGLLERRKAHGGPGCSWCWGCLAGLALLEGISKTPGVGCLQLVDELGHVGSGELQPLEVMGQGGDALLLLLHHVGIRPLYSIV